MGFKIDDSTHMSVAVTVTQDISWEGSLSDLPANIASHVRRTVKSDSYSMTIHDALFGALDTANARMWLQANGAVDDETISIEDVTYDV